MPIHKSPVTAIGSLSLATSSTTTLQPAIPIIQKFLEQGILQLSTLNIWNYLLILIAVIIEGPLATLLGGVWVAMGRVNFWGILFIAMLAGVLADSFWYYLGYFGREQVISRWGRYFRLETEEINKMETLLFGQNAQRVLFVAKLTSALIIPALIAAGMTNLGWRRVIRTLAPAQLLWSGGLITLGFLMADSYILISQKIENFGWVAGIIISLCALGYIFYRWRKMNETVELVLK